MNTLTAKDFCTIIETCSMHNVLSVEVTDWKNFKVVFATKPIEVENSTVSQPSEPQTDTTLSELPETEEDPNLLNEEQNFAELLIADPLEYEERLASGELVDNEAQNN